MNLSLPSRRLSVRRELWLLGRLRWQLPAIAWCPTSVSTTGVCCSSPRWQASFSSAIMPFSFACCGIIQHARGTRTALDGATPPHDLSDLLLHAHLLQYRDVALDHLSLFRSARVDVVSPRLTNVFVSKFVRPCSIAPGWSYCLACPSLLRLARCSRPRRPIMSGSSLPCSHS